MKIKSILHLAQQRLVVFATINGNAQGRIIATLFYFTILAPFALISRLTGHTFSQSADHWLERSPVPTDLKSAQRQG